MSIIPKQRGNVIFSANRTNQTDINVETNQTENLWKSLSIFNTGTNNLTFIVNGILIVVNANEIFDDDFEDFNLIDIRPQTSGQAISYKLVLRG